MPDDDLVPRVRSFQRLVTRRVGALQEQFLDRGRPLGASRLLWEAALAGGDVRELRARLGLDSGYLSRLLRRLEREGLVRLDAAATDRRVRVVRLTAAGRAECAELDRRSDAMARSVLAPLAPDEREALVTAMGTVERFLTLGLVQVGVEDPAGEGARACLERYLAELDERFDQGFDAARSIPAAPDDLAPPRGLLLVARLAEQPVGCGALRLHGDAPAEIKRMWVAREVRGVGLGRRILRELEDRARGLGAHAVQLETNRTLAEALALYRAAGYREVPAFNDEPYAHHWFRKELGPPSR